tara:strand:+ start:62 stop:691 length:630 start_codon:yes stop_codon:yes gene_type:complete
VKHNFNRPRGIMPSIFIKIDGIMKDYFEGKSPKDITTELPDGKVEFGDRWIQSKPFLDKKTGNRCFIKGKTDTVLGFNDNTFGVVDFKTSNVKDGNVEKYSRQLHAYSLALENAEPGKPSLKPISRIGLFVVEPNLFLKNEHNEYLFKNIVKWQEIPRNDIGFFDFLREVMSLLSQDKIPDAGPYCSHCEYIKKNKLNNFDDFNNKLAS